MNIIITGSLGNIGKPLTTILVRDGHQVTVISSKTERQREIEALGAIAAIGSIDDVAFLANTFKGADVVFLMEAVDRALMFDPGYDIIKAYSEIADNYKQALEQSGVKKAIHLSSIGAHTTEGNGVLSMHYHAEQVLNQLPNDVAVKFMRPVGFYSNLYRSVQSIKEQGAIISNYSGDAVQPWVSPLDIASTVAEEIEAPFDGRTIRYIASEEISGNEMAKILGEAIGNPQLKWLEIPDEQLLNGMLSAGMNEQIARGFIEMQAAQGNGTLYQDYYKNEPVLSPTKFTDFAKEFAKAYQQ